MLRCVDFPYLISETHEDELCIERVAAEEVGRHPDYVNHIKDLCIAGGKDLEKDRRVGCIEMVVKRGDFYLNLLADQYEHLLQVCLTAMNDH